MAFQIRIAEPSDAHALAPIYQYYVDHTVVTMDCTAPNATTFAYRMTQNLTRYPYLIAITEDNDVLGYAYAGAYSLRTGYDWSVELAIYVRHDDLTHGVGSALYDMMAKILTMQHVVNVSACITANNARSLDFHTSRGFTQAAVFPHFAYKFSQWWDIIWLTKQLRAGNQAPAAFVPFSTLRQRPSFRLPKQP
ncbi:MAG: N-acetyltransferase family protein [Schleiferilactobacillus perolens]|uniref:GNAT family N-acetyltransferase n=1 Tax=Schleiferilactobacillus perolens TaxID=100468 RepID=UPI0039EB43CE